MTAMEIRERAFAEVHRNPENYEMIAGNMGKAMMHHECEWPEGVAPQAQGEFIHCCLLELERRKVWADRLHTSSETGRTDA